MIKKFNEYNSQICLEKKEILGNYTGIDSALSKVMSYNKRLLYYNNNFNESYYLNSRPVNDVYFSSLEREGIKNLFEEFIFKSAETMVNELAEAGCEFNELDAANFTLGLNEGIMDRMNKAFDKVSSAVKSVADKVGGKIDNVKEYIKDTGEKIEQAKDDVKKKIIDKYKSIMDFLKKLVDAGIKTVKELISNVAKFFDKLGGCVQKALEKLGLFDEEKGEDKALVNVDAKLLDGIVNSEGEKSFVSHIVAYSCVMLGSNKETTEKLIGEGYENIQIDLDEDQLNEGLIDSLANNKVLQFIFQYGKGKHISIWKSIMISITGSLIISLGLPVILPLCGVSIAAVPTICAAIRFVWSMRGCFKICMNRYLERKPGEKFFDTKTCLLLAITILPQIPPFKDWIQEMFSKLLHWLGLDKLLEKAGDLLGKLIKQLYGKDPSIEIQEKAWTETVKNGGNVNFHDNFAQTNPETLKAMAKAGCNEKSRSIFSKFMNGLSDIGKPSDMHKYIDGNVDKLKDLAGGLFIDTKVHGLNQQIHEILIEFVKKHPECVQSIVGGDTLRDGSLHNLGSLNMIYNLSGDAKKELFAMFKEKGIDISKLVMTPFGSGVNVIHHAAKILKVNWLFDTIVASFSPQFYPWFDEKTFGKYKIRFASGTRGAAAYVVKEVKMQSAEEIGNDETSDAWDELKQLHSTAWDKYKKDMSKKRDEYDKKHRDSRFQMPDEPKYIVFYVDPNEDTGNANDKPTNSKDNKSGVKIGIIIDPISMMIADVCDFGEKSSAKTRRRPHPYFMKGLFSRLSFIPLEANDSDTKEFIRESLGETMRNLILSNITFGNGAGYVSAKQEGENKKLDTVISKDGKEVDGIKYEISNPNFITNEKVDEDKELIDMGNLSPKEAVTCLNDKKNKEAYDLLDGKYGSNVSISSKDGQTSIKAKKNNNTIENLHYYAMSESDYKSLCLKHDPTGNGKKKPRGIKVAMVDGKPVYYRRLSQSLIKKEKLNLKDDEKLTWAYVHIRPLLTDGRTKVVKGQPKVIDDSLPKKLKEDEKIKKMLYDGDKINDKVFKILDPFLYRPEKTFAKDDEHELAKALEKEGVEGEKLGWFKKMFKDEEQLHDTFKRLIEIIWDYLTENRRAIFKKKDTIKNHLKDGYEYDGDDELIEEEYATIFDELVAESLFEDYDEDEEMENDLYILNERKKAVPSFNRFLIENYNN